MRRLVRAKRSDPDKGAAKPSPPAPSARKAIASQIGGQHLAAACLKNGSGRQVDFRRKFLLRQNGAAKLRNREANSGIGAPHQKFNWKASFTNSRISPSRIFIDRCSWVAHPAWPENAGLNREPG